MRSHCVHLIHPLATWSSGTPKRLGVGLIHIWAVEGTTLNPGKGTPGARAEERALLISRILSETTLTDLREKLGGGISPVMWDMGKRSVSLVPWLKVLRTRLAAFLSPASRGRPVHSSFETSLQVGGFRHNCLLFLLLFGQTCPHVWSREKRRLHTGFGA